MFNSRTAYQDLLSSHRSNLFTSFQARSPLDDIVEAFRRNRSSSLNSSLRTKLLEWRDRRLNASPQAGAHRTASPLTLSNSTGSNSTLPDVTNLATAANNITAFRVNTQQIAGNLRANRFTVSSSVARTVISGNGNVDFGSGYRDLLDLSNLSYRNVNFNWASQTGGVVYNPGNGNRVFDAINFNDGRQVLFEGIDSIRFAEGTFSLAVTPNDPLFSRQWNLHMMGVHTAWRFTTGSTNVVVGIGDTGISINNTGAIHPELQSRTGVFGNQAIDDTRDNHGTAVHGIIAADSNNGIGMSGINWNSRVLQVDVLGGESGDVSTATAARAMINQARQNGQRLVINLSLGVPQSFGVNYDRELEQVVRDNPDVLFVIAAGNNGNLGREGLASPAFLARSYSNAMAVGAVWGTQADNGAATTPGTRIQYQGGWGSQYGQGLTVVAPSEVIAPTTRNKNGRVEFTYEPTFNGTSASAPNVTGVASLVLSLNPSLSASQVRQVLSQTAVDVGQRGYDIYTGSGVVNADSAVRRAMALSRGFA